MEWRQADVFQLIEQYKERKLLWDATVDDFKNRNKRHDAWAELDNKFAVPAGECEKKVRKLISQFNRECKKGYKSGRGAEENAKWIYFKSLVFLKDKNKPRTAMDGGFDEEDGFSTGDGSQVDVSNPEVEDGDEALPGNNAPQDIAIARSSIATPQQGALPSTLNSKTTPVSARARAPKRKTDAMAEEAYKVMKEMEGNKAKAKRDEFDAYGETVAMTLRKLSNISAVYAKYEINKILFQAELGQYEQPLSRSVSSATYTSEHSAHTSPMLTPPINSDTVQQSSAATPLAIYGHSHSVKYSNNQENVKSPSVLDDETQMTELLFHNL